MRALFILLTLLASASLPAAELRPEEFNRLQQLSQELQIPMADLQAAVQQAELRQPVLDAISKPWEAKPWYQYRPLFITDKRVQDGVVFWQTHAGWLKLAEERFGVPAQIIVAIIGVETRYASNMGSHPVLDALYTLGFHYPQRAPYFSREFAQFVKLAHQEQWPLRQPLGSYAGAMGMGQFMPTSYLHFAVDFDQDGHIDLFNNPADAIGSVANYFALHGWQTGAPIAYPAAVTDPTQIAHLLNNKLELDRTWQQLNAAGVKIDTTLPDTTPVKLLKLDGENAAEYWVIRQNFYVITRYNRSPLYAMVVNQLSEELARAYQSATH